MKDQKLQAPNIFLTGKEVVNRIHQIYEDSQKIKSDSVACQGGCAACCYLPVTCSNYEAELIVMVLDTIPSWMSEINFWPYQASEALGNWLEIFGDLLKIERLRGLSVQEKVTMQTILQVYLESKVKCPFLDSVTRHCSIYSVRPINCRTFMSLERCDQDNLLKVSGHDSKLRQYFKEKFTELQKRIQERTWRSGFMPVMVYQILQNGGKK